MKKPLIGITHSPKKNRIPYLCICLAIRLAGGKPLSLTSNKPQYQVKLNGLIISGGTDINPTRYGAQSKKHYIYDNARDQLEFEWLKLAEKNSIPVLGICRGAQLMNIFRKGTLHEDVAKAYEKAQYPNSLIAKIFYRKRMFIDEKSLLHQIIRRKYINVNSLHTQAVNQLGKNLKIVGKEKNNVVQAIEDPNRTYYLGVQFHPELMIYSKLHFQIFKILIKNSI